MKSALRPLEIVGFTRNSLRLPEITEIEEAIDPMPINELNLENPMTTNEYIDFPEERIIEDSIDKNVIFL